MGFPDDFIFRGSKTEITRQIGDAVPPRLASAVAMQVRTALQKSFEKNGGLHDGRLSHRRGNNSIFICWPDSSG